LSPDEAEAQTLEVPVGQKSSGEPVHESILVAVHGPDRYEVLASPAFAQGVARGDLVAQSAPRTELVVLRRGGNLALQVFAPHPAADELVPLVAEWGGSLDGRSQEVTAFSVPVRLGFATIEQSLETWLRRHPGAEWYFGNVYATDGVTPLEWW
jgi:hypothetical protein